MSANAQIDLRGNMTRRVQDMRSAASRFVRIAEPWDITFAMDGEVPTCELTNCCFSRDPLFFWIGTKTATITPGAESTWVSAKINTFDATCTILTGDYEDVIDLAIPADPTYVKKLLYKIEASSNLWRIVLDVRNIGLTLRV